MAGKTTTPRKSPRTPTKQSESKAPKRTFTKSAARRAAEKAKVAFADSKLPASWEPGGRDWSRVLGHFGASKG